MMHARLATAVAAIFSATGVWAGLALGCGPGLGIHPVCPGVGDPCGIGCCSGMT
jgi:hypothetical protein